MTDIVEAEAALDAEPVLVRRSVAAADMEELVVLDVVGELAADPAIRANAVHLAVGKLRAHVGLVDAASTASARRSDRPARIRRRRRRSSLPSGSSKSNTIFSVWPRPAMPITSLTCTSRQARTQRLQWMQASRLTAIAGWLRSGTGAARRGNRLASIFCRSAVFQNSDCGSCATSLDGWSAMQQLDHHPPRGFGAVGLGPDLHARAWACGCSLPPARARPRPPPCRRGNCRPGDSPAWANSTDAAA